MARTNQRSRSDFYTRPAAFGVAAAALAAVVVSLDRAHSRGRINYPGILEAGSAEDARTILITVASISLTVVTLLASLTFVALSFATSTVGPRQLRSFLRDRTTQYTFATFIGTFVYCLIVLLFYRGNDPQGKLAAFAPHLGAVTALLLALIATAMLVAYIHNLTRAIQPNYVLIRIVKELDRAMVDYGQARSLHAPSCGSIDDGEMAHIAEERREPYEQVTAQRSGYVQQIDHDPLVDVARQHDAMIRFTVRPGQFVLQGNPIAHVWGLNSAVEASIHRVTDVGGYRTLAQDLEFAVDQLVEVALRALSPAINDTFTALSCVDWLGEALRKFATTDVGTPVHCDAAGHVRVIDRPVRFQSLVTAAFAKIRQSGANNPAVVMRLLETHTAIVGFLTAAQRSVLRTEIEATAALAATQKFAAIDTAGVHTRAVRAREACSGLGPQ